MAEQYEHALKLEHRPLLGRIDKQMAHAESEPMREMLRDCRLAVCELSADLWAAEAGAGLDGAVIGMLRESALKVVGGNCAFIDDDVALLAGLAERAIKAGLTEGLAPSVLKHIEEVRARQGKP